MKKIIQLFLFLVTLIIIIIFYNKYFKSEQISKVKSFKQQKKQETENNSSNLIKNLRYDLKLQDNSKYMIVANESDIFYEGNTELVRMTGVTAKFIDSNNFELVINANKALFNSATYNTNFLQNVNVSYKKDTILSENLDLDFTKNIVTIYDNVIYQGLKGEMITDNIKINIITKKIEIFMDNKNAKVKVISK